MDERIEQLARRMCRRAGQDPDMQVLTGTPHQIMTPLECVIAVLPSSVRPLWTRWLGQAQAAVEWFDEQNGKGSGVPWDGATPFGFGPVSIPDDLQAHLTAVYGDNFIANKDAQIVILMNEIGRLQGHGPSPMVAVRTPVEDAKTGGDR